MGVYFLTNEDEKNYIKSINGVAPDESGNVEVAVSDSGGNVDPEQIANAVKAWLDEHPEATTTVRWGNVADGEIFELSTEEEPDVSVPVPCTGITLDKTELAFSDIETTATLVATVTPFDTTDQIEWRVDNSGVATVENGVVKAIANGSCVITAKCGAYSATCAVTVNIIVSYTKANLDGYFDFVDVEDNYFGTVENKATDGTLVGEIYKYVKYDAAAEPTSVESGVLVMGSTDYLGAKGKRTRFLVYDSDTKSAYRAYPYTIETYAKMGADNGTVSYGVWGSNIMASRYDVGIEEQNVQNGTLVMFNNDSTIGIGGAVGEGNGTITLDSAVDVTEYHHYVVCVDSALVRVYIDGVCVGESTEGNNNISGSTAKFATNYTGALKMCRVYNAILTDEQVANNYANTLGVYGGDA